MVLRLLHLLRIPKIPLARCRLIHFSSHLQGSDSVKTNLCILLETPVFGASLCISLVLIQCQEAHTAAWYLKALTGTTICFVWHKICCIILQKYCFLQSVEFSEVTSICLSYLFFSLVTLHHFSEWFQVVRNDPNWVYTRCFSVNDTSLSARVFTKWLLSLFIFLCSSWGFICLLLFKKDLCLCLSAIGILLFVPLPR